MASRELERIRTAILDQRYTLSEHAYDEMDQDKLDVLDVEAAILTGKIVKSSRRIRVERDRWSSAKQRMKQRTWESSCVSSNMANF